MPDLTPENNNGKAEIYLNYVDLGSDTSQKSQSSNYILFLAELSFNINLINI